MKGIDAGANQRRQRQQQYRLDRQRPILKFLTGASGAGGEQGDQQQHGAKQTQAAMIFRRPLIF